MKQWAGIIEEYRDFLPVTDMTPRVTLFEGNTPLIRAEKLSEELDLEIFLKLEGLNPTGSFKDRGLTLAVSKALEEKKEAVICASTGNTSASTAAYAAKAGLKCLVLIPEAKVALGKLAQALTHNAKVATIKGSFDQALKIVRALAEKYPQFKLVNSLNPYRLEGQKTAAFEICDALGEAPHYLALPVGNAGNITAYWLGFREHHKRGKITNLPKMFGFQAEGAAPIVRGKIIEDPQTIASAIRIGNPARWKEALEAASSSNGRIEMVKDQEILTAYRELASEEGLFVEPASAASLAGLKKLRSQNLIESETKVVLVLTGHGLKDPNIAVEIGQEKIIKSEATLEAVEKAIF